MTTTMTDEQIGREVYTVFARHNSDAPGVFAAAGRKARELLAPTRPEDVEEVAKYLRKATEAYSFKTDGPDVWPHLARAVIARYNASPALAVTEDVLRDALARERREWGQSTIDTRGAVDMALDAIRPFLAAPNRTAEVERLTAERDDLKLWFAECDSIVEGHVKCRAELTAELATVTERLRAVEANLPITVTHAMRDRIDRLCAALHADDGTSAAEPPRDRNPDPLIERDDRPVEF